MRKIVALALFTAALQACSEQKKTESTSGGESTAAVVTQASPTPSLQKVWETDTVLTTVESTLGFFV